MSDTSTDEEQTREQFHEAINMSAKQPGRYRSTTLPTGVRRPPCVSISRAGS